MRSVGGELAISRSPTLRIRSTSKLTAELRQIARRVMKGVAEIEISSARSQPPAGATRRPSPKLVRVEWINSPVPGAPPEVADQAYQIAIRRTGIVIMASAPAGFRYALITLRAIIAASRNRIRAVDVIDWPDFKVRGVMLDVSRDKVPTMATLRRLIAMFAALKYNQLQLYIEHTFRYRDHPAVWRGASPFTPAQIRTIDRECRSCGIELVPNQNSLGHMERWLKHDRYAPLAEYDGPYLAPWGETRTLPTTLNPIDPRSIRLVDSLYAELLPCFSSRILNVGCDEPFELGQGKSRKRCEEIGAGRVYFDFLMKIRRAAAVHGRRIQFWSDWIQHNPEMIDRLPRDVTSLVWGYEADHPFELECSRSAKAGVPFYVCPGTSSWCSIAGRTSNMKANLLAAAEAGRTAGAEGYLLTDWGDYGHRQTLPVSYAGFLYAAAVAWCRKSNADIDLGDELSRRVFEDKKGVLGRAWLDAGRVHELSGALQKNRSVLFSCLAGDLFDPKSSFGVKPSAVGRIEDRIAMIRGSLAKAAPKSDDAKLVMDEIRLTLDVLEHACHRLRLIQAPADSNARVMSAKRLAREMRAIMREHARIWRLRNRPGGLASSLSYYERNLEEYRTLLRS